MQWQQVGEGGFYMDRLLGLSHGYLSRLGAGDWVPGAQLVCLLALLAAHPELIDQIESYWTLPPGE